MRQWFLATGLFLAILAVAAPVRLITASQVPAVADAAISGVVIDGGTKQPIADAVVQLGSVRQRDFPDFTERQFTDAKGRFVFTNLPAGAGYAITATKSGYFVGNFGAVAETPETRRTITLTGGQWFSTADVTMWRPSSMSGTVTDERGEPVIGVLVRAIARIRVAGSEHLAVGQLTTTDDRGRFRIGMLTAGSYAVMVPSVQASVPVARLQDMAAQVARGGGGRAGPPPNVTIDIDANTRMAVSRYAVPPPSVDGRRFTYPVTFSGGSSLSPASFVTVGVGADLDGVDVRLSPVPAVRIAGTVDGPADALTNLTLRLLAEGLEDLGLGSEAGTALVASDGSFVFANVPAGNYTIDLPASINQYLVGNMGIFYTPQIPRPPGMTGGASTGAYAKAAPPGAGFSTMVFPTRMAYWSRTPVTAAAGTEPRVVVSLRRTASVRGRIVNDPDPNQPVGSDTFRSVELESAQGSAMQGVPRGAMGRTLPAGEFGVEGVLPGLYVFRGSSGGASSPWIVKSVVLNGRDITYTPIEVSAGTDVLGVIVTFTNAVPSLTGTVRDAANAPATDAAVIVFPVEPEQWTHYGLNPTRILTATTSTAGTFRFRSLPAGEYYVVAVPAGQMNAWQSANFFERAQASATRVTLAWGEQKTADVRVSQVR